VREKSCGGPFEECTFTELDFGTTIGAGLAPLGLRERLLAHQRIRVEVSDDVGLLWFRQAVPDPAATRLNAFLAAGGELDLRLTEKLWARVGYLRHHLSNGGRGEANPALDAHLLVLGISE
jgi:hypothetical protein